MKKSIKYILIVVITVAIVAKIMQAFIIGDKALQNMERTEFKLSREDSSLFSDELQNKFIVDAVYRSKGRNSVAVVEVSKQYRLLITKISIDNDKPLDSVLSIQQKSSDATTFNAYSITQVSKDYELKLNSTPHLPVNKVLLFIKGDSLQTTKLDSMELVTVNVANLSLRYGEGAPTDLYINRKKDVFDGKLKPMSILFLKRGRELNILMLAALKPNINIPPNLLLELIKK